MFLFTAPAVNRWLLLSKIRKNNEAHRTKIHTKLLKSVTGWSQKQKHEDRRTPEAPPWRPKVLNSQGGGRRLEESHSGGVWPFLLSLLSLKCHISGILWASKSQASSFGVVPPGLVRHGLSSQQDWRDALMNWGSGAQTLGGEPWHSLAGQVVPTDGHFGMQRWAEAERSSSKQDAVKDMADKSSVTSPEQNSGCKKEERELLSWRERKWSGFEFLRFGRLEFSAVCGIALGQPFTPYKRKLQKDWCSSCFHCSFWWWRECILQHFFAKESKAVSLFSPLRSGIVFVAEGVSFFKRKRRLW